MKVCKTVCAIVLISMHGNLVGAAEPAGPSGNGPGQLGDTPPVYAQSPVYEAPPTLQELRRREREERQRNAAIERLHRCQEKEGPDFSQEKYDIQILNPSTPALSLRLSADPNGSTRGLGLTGRF